MEAKLSVAPETERAPEQARPLRPQLDVNPIADAIAAAVVSATDMPGLKWKSGRLMVTLDYTQLLPETNVTSQTRTSRRERLMNRVAEMIAPHGWILERGRTFVRTENKVP